MEVLPFEGPSFSFLTGEQLVLLAHGWPLNTSGFIFSLYRKIHRKEMGLQTIPSSLELYSSKGIFDILYLLLSCSC